MGVSTDARGRASVRCCYAVPALLSSSSVPKQPGRDADKDARGRLLYRCRARCRFMKRGEGAQGGSSGMRGGAPGGRGLAGSSLSSDPEAEREGSFVVWPLVPKPPRSPPRCSAVGGGGTCLRLAGESEGGGASVEVST